MEEIKGQKIQVLDLGYVRLVDFYGNDQRIVEAARVSYDSSSKGEEQDKKLLQYLYKNFHTSPFEQVAITYEIKLPLFVQAQLKRNRTQRLNEQSYRYTEPEEHFYIPNEWRRQDTKNKQGSCVEAGWDPIIANDKLVSVALQEHCDKAYDLYIAMLDAGIAREMARMVLPQNLYTKIYTNWDLNNLTKFFTLRLDAHAQLEIQEYAKAMYTFAKQLFPWTIEAFDKYKLAHAEQSGS
jgi:thymidylate synthase (FAD)